MKTFIKKSLTICLLYLNTVVLTYSVQHAWNNENTHVFYARLCIFIPIAIVTFVLATYLLIKIVKRVTYNGKKEIKTNEYKKRLAKKHQRWQAYFNSVDVKYHYHIYNNNGSYSRYIYDNNGDCIGYIID